MDRPPDDQPFPGLPGRAGVAEEPGPADGGPNRTGGLLVSAAALAVAVANTVGWALFPDPPCSDGGVKFVDPRQAGIGLTLALATVPLTTLLVCLPRRRHPVAAVLAGGGLALQLVVVVALVAGWGRTDACWNF